MTVDDTARTASEMTRLVLNAGAGPAGPNSLHGCFRAPGWREVRLDLNPAVSPDVLGSVTDLHGLFADGTFDAIWSSHNIEHLYDHEVTMALGEFHRVLKPDGFAVITCPDLECVAELLIERGLHGKVYDAPIGPITVHDMVFGHGGSVAAGNGFMAHRTGFTQDRLGIKATQSGFADVRVGRGTGFDLWAVLPKSERGAAAAAELARGSDLAFLFGGEVASA
jgi:SAM-dependent methyltransferase